MFNDADAAICFFYTNNNNKRFLRPNLNHRVNKIKI
jgi:hypothetical protein